MQFPNDASKFLSIKAVCGDFAAVTSTISLTSGQPSDLRLKVCSGELIPEEHRRNAVFLAVAVRRCSAQLGKRHAAA